MIKKPFKAYQEGGLVVNIFAWYYNSVITKRRYISWQVKN
jgi:hypothetical protein